LRPGVKQSEARHKRCLICMGFRFHATVAVIFLEILNVLFLEEDCQPESLK